MDSLVRKAREVAETGQYLMDEFATIDPESAAQARAVLDPSLPIGQRHDQLTALVSRVLAPIGGPLVGG